MDTHPAPIYWGLLRWRLSPMNRSDETANCDSSQSRAKSLIWKIDNRRFVGNRFGMATWDHRRSFWRPRLPILTRFQHNRASNTRLRALNRISQLGKSIIGDLSVIELSSWYGWQPGTTANRSVVLDYLLSAGFGTIGRQIRDLEH